MIALLEVAKRGHSGIGANRTRSALLSCFGWARAMRFVSSNPVEATLKPLLVERSRERVLTDGELVAIWNACRDDDYGRIVRLLMLTGQRRDEVGSMCWSEIDLEAGL